jgi:hypothetical protein
MTDSPQNYSLARILRDASPDFHQRIDNQKKLIARDTNNMLGKATEYSQKYETEIAEGTEKRRLLIETGIERGGSPEEVVTSYGVFIPDKKTPILNMLHFLTQEYEGASDAVQILREDKDKNINYNQLKTGLNEKFGGLTVEDIEQDIPDILEYVYENVTTEIFKKIKKLKTLATDNPRTPEQYAAYGKAMELCKKYKLSYDKLPTYA